MNSMTLLAASFSVLTVMVIFGVIIFSRQDQTVNNRLDTYLGTDSADRGKVILPSSPDAIPLADRVFWPVIRQIANFVGKLLPQNQVATLRNKLTMAGNPSGLGVTEFMGIKGFSTLVMLGLALGFGSIGGMRATPTNLGMLLGLALCAFQLPEFWLAQRITRRQKQLINELPDALDLLTIASAAGLSFENAMQEIEAKSKNSEIAREFGRVLRDIGMGQNRRQALTGLAERTGVPDIASFVSAIKQAESLGVSIGRVLTVQSEELRTKRRQRAQETANQAPVKMMFPLVFLIFPAIFAVLLGPAVPQILQAFDGL